MKALSVWQPWASLFFCPYPYRKLHETRSRGKGLQCGERIAIQAAQTTRGIKMMAEIPDADREYIARALHALYGDITWDQLPLGCILGTVEIGQTVATDAITVTDQERAFGDWRPLRVAIETMNPSRLEIPVPCIGRQGVFKIDEAILSREAA